MASLNTLVFVLFCLGHFASAFRPRRFIAEKSHDLMLACTMSVHNRVSDRDYSFVQDELRPVAMKLHTRDQAPREGQQEEQTPFTRWQPSRQDYTQFLVDSLEVYDTFEDIMASESIFSKRFACTGLERSQSIKESLEWIKSFDESVVIPECGAAGHDYAAFLRDLVGTSVPKFMCHYYNHYFAHTAGGRMIGKKIGDSLFDGKVLEFYQWNGDVRQSLESTRKKIDDMADEWNEEEKRLCMDETACTFRYGGGLMTYLREPRS